MLCIKLRGTVPNTREPALTNRLSPITKYESAGMRFSAEEGMYIRDIRPGILSQ